MDATSPGPAIPDSGSHRLIQPLRHQFAAGATVSAGATVAVIWSLASESSYRHIVDTAWHSSIAKWADVNSLRALSTNAVLTIFFFAVGLELSREVRSGALQRRREAVLPVLAAIGGMAGTALVFVAAGLIFSRHQLIRGWGVPTATDIAFTLGALALVGRRVPSQLRLFLLTLAIADDLLAVIILGIFYQHHAKPLWLVVALVIVAPLILRKRPLPIWCYYSALAGVWLCFAAAKIEPSLAGVVVGLSVPFKATDVGARLDRQVQPWSNGLALPLFALCACGVYWSQLVWSTNTRQVVIAVVVARLLGKFIGIFGAVIIAERFGLSLPRGISRSVLASASIFCAIGFTVPLLFASTVYGPSSAIYAAVTFGLLFVSMIAALGGVAIMRIVLRSHQN